jgi:hypothetical protein
MSQAELRLFHNCQVERCILWRSGHAFFNGNIVWENEDYRIEAHNVPLWSDRERNSGVCDSCFSGWEHPDNAATPKGLDQIKAAKSEAGSLKSARSA